MPLILAIEPDRRQGAHLSAVIRRRVTAELILVGTTQAALDAIGNRVPDLVLVPALLSPQDDAALAAALRVIAAAAHVQMLTIPVLGASRPTSRAGGVLAALRRDKSRAAEPDGCDPSVFAEQIASYLERAAEEHAAEAELADTELAPATPRPVTPPLEAMGVDAPELAVAAPEEIDPALIEFGEPAAPQDTEDGVSAALEEAMRALFINDGPSQVPVDESFDSPADEPAEDAVAAPVAQLPAPPIEEPAWAPLETPADPVHIEAPAAMSAESLAVDDFMQALEALPLASIEAVVDPWSGRIVDEVDEPREDAVWTAQRSEQGDEFHGAAVQGLEAREEISARPAEEAETAPGPRPAQEVRPAQQPAAAARSEVEWVALIDSLRRDVERLRTERAEKAPPRSPAPRPVRTGKKSKPAQDEWGLFDPEQCGFAALLAKLEEVTE
jgi:hypothetical protein